MVIASLNGDESDLVLLEGISFVRIITDGTRYDKTIEGIFEFCGFDSVSIVGSDVIPIEYVEEIEILG